MSHTIGGATWIWALVLGAWFAGSGRAQAPAAPPSRSAQLLVDQAIATARSEHKTVLVVFGASWCGPCHRFTVFLHAPVVGQLMSDNYVVVSLRVFDLPALKALENPGASDLMKAMGGGEGIPFFYFEDTTGTKLADSRGGEHGSDIGYPGTPSEADAFGRLLQATAPRMTALERAQIWRYLTKG